MALGGGTFLVQNKVLPGTYINFVSAASATATLSERGTATMPLELDWGPEGEVFEVTSGDFQKNSMSIFGYEYTNEKLKGLRDLFINAETLYAYRLGTGGVKASNDYATAKYPGVRGNDIKIIVAVNVDEEDAFDVTTMVESTIVDEQTVTTASELTNNDYVTWKSGASLAVTAGMPLEGGENAVVNGASYQTYLDKIESYSYNTMGVVTTDDTTKRLFVQFCERLRDEMGIKFQLVVYNYSADYYGVINVKNPIVADSTVGSGIVGEATVNWSEASLVYWVTGATAGCEVNKSNLNKVYDGEFSVYTDYTQSELEKAIAAGEFTFHLVGDDVRVLEDINSMVTVSDTQGDIFKENQTVRVCDQIANDIAVIFNTRYLGVVPNDNAGRIALWSDLVKYHQQLNDIRAIEDFDENDITVEQGDTKKAVLVNVAITVVNAMGKLYMIVTVA